MKGGVLNLNNVTTINQNTDVVGFGILIDNDVTNATINVNGLNSYNWLTEADVAKMQAADTTSDAPMPTILSGILSSKAATAINVQIICLNTNDGIVVTNFKDAETANIGGNDGRLWSETGDAVIEAPEFEYGAYAPANPDVSILNLPTEPAASAPYAYWDDGNVIIGINSGSSYELNLKDILEISGAVNASIAAISVDGTTISGYSYTFSKSGPHNVTYTIVDTGAYAADGTISETENRMFTYSINVEVSVAEIEDAVVTTQYGSTKMPIAASSSKEFTVDVPVLQGLTITDNGNTIIDRDTLTVDDWNVGTLTTVNSTDLHYKVVLTHKTQKNSQDEAVTLEIEVRYLNKTSAKAET